MSDEDLKNAYSNYSGAGQGAPGPVRPMASEGPVASGVRAGAGAVGGAAGAMYGAGLGAEIGAVGGPLGAFAGGVVGAIGGAIIGSYAEQGGKEVLGIDDSMQMAVNAEAHPWITTGAEMAVGLGGMAPVKGLQLGARAAGAGLQGSMEVGNQVYQGEFDPGRIAMQAAAGGAFPGLNRLGERLTSAGKQVGARLVSHGTPPAVAPGGQGQQGATVPGRPNQPANPDAAQTKVDVGAQHVENAVAGSAADAQQPIRNDSTIGNEQSRPTNSQGEEATGKTDSSYLKKPSTQGTPNDMLTKGDMDPGTAAALAGDGPRVEPGAATFADEGAPPAPAPNKVLPNPVSQEAEVAPPAGGTAPETKNDLASAPRSSENEGGQGGQVGQKTPFDPAQHEDAGFPKPGEPIAVGENEMTPMPAEPTLKGKTNPNPTDGQKEAGNFEKAREKVAGMEVAYESMKGTKRTGKDAEGKPWESDVPADYGYFVGTRGADSPKVGNKEGIDVHNLRNGDKHFIVDQENLDTGKFDEHKVMANAADHADAYNTYVKAYSDGKGAQRIHDITEVSADELKNWAGGHGKSTKKAYGAKFETTRTKPVQERAVVKDAIEKLEAQGKTAEAEALKTAPEDKVRAAIEGKRTRKYGVSTGTSAGYAIEGVQTAKGTPATANSAAKAAAYAVKHKEVTNWFEESKPPSQMDASKETDGELLDRIKGIPRTTWEPAHSPKEWMLLKKARNALSKPTPGNIQKLRDAERFLRGDDAAVESYRASNKGEADSKLNRNIGDHAVDKAEAQRAKADAGTNSEEDAMAERLDAKKGAFTEDETDLPPKEIHSAADLTPPDTGRLDLTKPADRLEHAAFFNKDVKVEPWKVEADAKAKTVAERLAAQRAAREAAAPKGSGEAVPKVDLKAAAQARKEAALERAGNADDEPTKGGFRDLVDRFKGDESGSVNPSKIFSDMKAFLKSTSAYLPKMPKAPPPPPPAAPAAASPKKPFWNSARSEPKTYMPRDLEPNSLEEYQSELSDRFKQHDNEQVMHEKAVKDHVDETVDGVPKGRLQGLDQAIIFARDEDALAQRQPGRGWRSIEGTLKTKFPEAYKLYKDRLEGMYNQNDAVAERIADMDQSAIGAKTGGLHVYRMRDSDDPALNDRASRFKDPLSSVNPLSDIARGTAKDRDFFALERASDGKRYIIQPDDKGYHVWNNGKIVQSVKDPSFKFEDGAHIQVGSQDLMMTDATMKEIEGNVKDKQGKYIKYKHSAIAAAAQANLQLTEQMHHMEFTRELMADHRFDKYRTTDPEDQRVIDGKFVRTKLGEFKDVFFDKKVAHVLDDYASDPLLGNREAVQAARNLSVGIMKTMFWNPIIHPLSVGSHFYPARGWDNFTPSGLASLAKTMPKAFNSVVNYGALDREILGNGGSLMHTGTVTKDVVGHIFEKVGLAIDKDPEAWDKIADKLGIKGGTADNAARTVLRPANKLRKAIFDGSQNITWASNDLFYKTLYLEHKAKGLPPKAAINATEKDLPNYRVAPELMGSRGLSQMMQDRLVSGFGPFHTGVGNSYMNMIHGMISKEGTQQDRLDAVGKLFALAVMGGVIAPLLDKGVKKLTGNPGSEVVRRSALAVPHEIYKATQGTADPQEMVRRLAMLSPGLSMAKQAYDNKDFGDRPIIQPGDFANAAHGSWRAGARAIKGAGEFALGNAIQPVGQVLRETHKQNGGFGTGIGDALGLYTNPSPSARQYMAKQPGKAQKNAVGHYKKGDWLDKQIGFK